MKRRLRVDVRPGMFQKERTVSFEAGGRRYVLMVDEEDVKDGTLTVYVVDEQGDEALVDLPRDTFTSGSRVRIPNSVLLPA